MVVDLVGIEEPSRGRNCEVHDCCGLVLELDMVVRFRAIQIAVEGKEESAIAVSQSRYAYNSKTVCAYHNIMR
jgi:hypothetical protein